MCKILLDGVWPFLVLIKTHLFFATKQYQRSSDIFLEDTQKLCLRDWVQHYITPVWIHVIDDWIITYWYLKFIIVQRIYLHWYDIYSQKAKVSLQLLWWCQIRRWIYLFPSNRSTPIQIRSQTSRLFHQYHCWWAKVARINIF